jgi:hypothetical protein
VSPSCNNFRLESVVGVVETRVEGSVVGGRLIVDDTFGATEFALVDGLDRLDDVALIVVVDSSSGSISKGTKGGSTTCSGGIVVSARRAASSFGSLTTD